MEKSYLKIDGSMGEGGGQVLRASLALSMALGTPFHISNIRANRPKPGLKRQHLSCVTAAREICGARVEGDFMGSTSISFAPGKVRPGEYDFAIGTGGSVCLVLQALLPPLLAAPAPSRLSVSGGTHVPYAPSFEFMSETLFPRLEAMGPCISATMKRPGYMDVGGGKVSVAITPGDKFMPLQALEAAPHTGAEAIIYCHGIPDVGEREAKIMLAPDYADLGLEPQKLRFASKNNEATAPAGNGNAVILKLYQGESVTVLGEIGWRGRSAEVVARQACKRAMVFKRSGAPVERHLADQLLVPMALAGGGTFVTEKMTPHTRTCLDVIELFTPLKAQIEQEGGKCTRVTLK